VFKTSCKCVTVCYVAHLVQIAGTDCAIACPRPMWTADEYDRVSVSLMHACALSPILLKYILYTKFHLHCAITECIMLCAVVALV
jgi:hypothetical protein